MDFLTRTYVRITERKGQAMTEYALIIAAVAVVCIVSYQALGNAVKNQVNNIISDL